MTPRVATSSSSAAPLAYGHGPGLWGLMMSALWLNGVALCLLAQAGNVQSGRAGVHWIEAVGLCAAMGLVAMFTAHQWMMAHDFLTTLSMRDRLGAGLIVLLIFCAPMFSNDQHPIPDGFVWAMPYLLLLCVTPSLVRRTLAWSLVGAWCAARGLRGGEPSALGLVIFYGFTWLAAAGAAHFCAVGHAHGLAGWWPARRTLSSALAVTIPSALAAVAVWWLWPAAGPGANLGSAGPGHAPRPLPPVQQMSEVELATLFWQGAVSLFLLVLLFAFMLYMRRLLMRRQKPHVAQGEAPAQISQLEYEKLEPKRRAGLGLTGARRHVARLWARWSRAMAAESGQAGAGQTVRQYADQVTRLDPAAAAGEQMLALTEKAHYGAQEPTPQEIAQMEQLVEDALSRQSLRQGQNAPSLEEE